MSAAERAFVDFLRDVRLGSIHAGTTEAALRLLLPGMWEPLDDLVAAKLLMRDDLECTFREGRLSHIKLCFPEGVEGDAEEHAWVGALDARWYASLHGVDIGTMRALLRLHGVAHSCMFFDDDSVEIVAVGRRVAMGFWPEIRYLTIYHLPMHDWRGSDSVRGVIEFP